MPIDFVLASDRCIEVQDETQNEPQVINKEDSCLNNLIKELDNSLPAPEQKKKVKRPKKQKK